MLKSQILPENCYETKNLSRNDVIEAYKKDQTITGYVEKILPNNKELSIKLGDDLYAILPFDEATIYPFTYGSKFSLPKEIYTLFNKHIRIKVSLISGDFIYVSRKRNMEDAYSHLKDCTSVKFYINSVLDTRAFGDIGEGIAAMLDIRQVCVSRIRNISEYLHKDDLVWVNIMGEDDIRRFYVSYKDTFKPYNPSDYHKGDVIKGIVSNELSSSDSPGIYMNISPNVTGIMDVTHDTPLLNYGDTIKCRVRKAGKNGLKLSFLSKIEE